MIKSITARQIFKDFPQVKKQLWDGEFWSDGYFISTVGKHGDENMIGKYVQNQGVKQPYKKLHTDYQLRMFEWRVIPRCWVVTNFYNAVFIALFKLFTKYNIFSDWDNCIQIK